MNKKPGLITALLTTMTVAATLMTATGSANANSGDLVTWKNHKTNYFLTFEKGGIVKGNYGTGSNNHWQEIKNSDGSWNLITDDGYRYCLTGYYRQVYTEPCDGAPNGTNTWERWYEIPTQTGWALKNRQTGYILDDDGNGNIYANSNDVGNSDPNQRWY
ncbi:hypothetical protein [Streptomyces aureus]|uniref:hypothetical protein n=1 Tax=Streptomyces aureus TaxID=193461 RepID=UPI000569A438|nr:hypothetical protein [Streptomyces aureus]